MSEIEDTDFEMDTEITDCVHTILNDCRNVCKSIRKWPMRFNIKVLTLVACWVFVLKIVAHTLFFSSLIRSTRYVDAMPPTELWVTFLIDSILSVSWLTLISIYNMRFQLMTKFYYLMISIFLSFFVLDLVGLFLMPVLMFVNASYYWILLIFGDVRALRKMILFTHSVLLSKSTSIAETVCLVENGNVDGNE